MSHSATSSGLTWHAAAAYRKTRVNTASDHVLLLEMHDAAIACVLSPVSTLEAGNPLMRAHALISELQATLQPEHDAALAQSLNSLYDAILARIVDAYIADHPEPLLSVAAALRELRAAWSQLHTPGPRRDSGVA